MQSSGRSFSDRAESHSVIAPGEVPERTQRFYLPELDTLRFFAFLFIFIVHVARTYEVPLAYDFPFNFWPPGLSRTFIFIGNYGVDLFFALSAFLLTRLLLRERAATGSIDVWAFYMRRLLRIWPLYFFFIAFIACLGHFSPLFAVRPVHLLVLVMFLANFQAVLFPGVTGPALALRILWSVSVEEQFYLVWPQVVRRTSVRGTRFAALAMFAASTLAPSVARMSGHWGRPVWTNTFFRLDSFAVGILIGTIPHVVRMRPISRVLLIVGGLTLWLFAAHYSPYGELTGNVLQMMLAYPAIALGAGALLLAALGTGAAYSRLAANRGLVYLGKVSYGLYVYHAFALCLAKLVMNLWLRGLALHWPGVMLPLAFPIYLLLSFVLTLGMAMVSYKWLESPFLRLKDRFTFVPSRPV